MTNLFPKPKNELEDFDNRPLTEVENKKIRKIIRDQERMEWLWASARIWIGWVLAGVASIYAAKDWINKILKAIFQ
jgi:hypothetical protein